MQKAYEELQETIRGLLPRLPRLTVRELEDAADDSVGSADLTNRIIVSYSILADGAVLELARMTAGKTDRARLVAAVGLAERTAVRVVRWYNSPAGTVRWVRDAALRAWKLVDEEFGEVTTTMG